MKQVTIMKGWFEYIWFGGRLIERTAEENWFLFLGTTGQGQGFAKNEGLPRTKVYRGQGLTKDKGLQSPSSLLGLTWMNT